MVKNYHIMATSTGKESEDTENKKEDGGMISSNSRERRELERQR